MSHNKHDVEKAMRFGLEQACAIAEDDGPGRPPFAVINNPETMYEWFDAAGDFDHIEEGEDRDALLRAAAHGFIAAAQLLHERGEWK
jgi:hypothetical protein